MFSYGGDAEGCPNRLGCGCVAGTDKSALSVKWADQTVRHKKGNGERTPLVQTAKAQLPISIGCCMVGSGIFWVQRFRTRKYHQKPIRNKVYSSLNTLGRWHEV